MHQSLLRLYIGISPNGVHKNREQVGFSCQKKVKNVTHLLTTLAENATEVMRKCVTFVSFSWPCMILVVVNFVQKF